MGQRYIGACKLVILFSKGFKTLKLFLSWIVLLYAGTLRVCVCGILHSEGVVVTLAAVLGAGESDFTPHRRNSNCSDRGLPPRALRGPGLSTAQYTPHHQVPRGPRTAALLSFSET